MKRSWLVRMSIVVVLGAGAVWVAGRARAGGIAASKPMQFTGTITEMGVPVNGQRDITVNLYDASSNGTLLCSTIAPLTTVAQGRFSVQLIDDCTKYIQGDAASMTANRPDTWVEVQVAGVSYGRQKVGAVPYAVTAGAVNGVVTSTAVLPASAQDGVYGRGVAGASIYNDSNAHSLVVTGNNSGGTSRVTLKQNVDVTGALSAASLTTTGDITVGGKVTITPYVKSAADAYTVGCDNGDTAIAGGLDCHADWDQMVLQTHPVVNASNVPVGWGGRCMNHTNSGLQGPPATIYVVCMSHGK